MLAELPARLSKHFPNTIVFSATSRQYADALVERVHSITGVRIVDDLTKLPFPDSYFDVVRSVTAWICVSRSKWRDFLTEINRILKPG